MSEIAEVIRIVCYLGLVVFLVAALGCIVFYDQVGDFLDWFEHKIGYRGDD